MDSMIRALTAEVVKCEASIKTINKFCFLVTVAFGAFIYKEKKDEKRFKELEKKIKELEGNETE